MSSAAELNSISSDETFAIREVKRDLAYIKAELRDSDARYKSWKEILSEECRGNEEHFKSKLTMVQNRFIALVDELKVSVNNCKAEVQVSKEENVGLIEQQNQQMQYREEAQSKMFAQVKEMIAKSVKEQNAKASLETAKVAEVFLKRMEEERENMLRNVRQSGDSSTRRIDEQTATSQREFRGLMDDCKEQLSATFSKNMNEQKIVLDTALSTGLTLLDDSISERFNKRMETQRTMLESNFLQGMDRLEAWLKRKNEKRDAEIEVLRQALQEQLESTKRMETQQDEQRSEIETWVQTKLNGLERQVGADQERNTKELQNFGRVLQDKDEFFERLKESMCSNQTRMVKDCMMLNIRVNALQDKADKQSVAYSEFTQHYERVKAELEGVVDSQREMFEAYENKVLQHASDFQSYLDEHSSATDEMHARFTELTEEFDALQEKVLEEVDVVETAREVAAEIQQGRQDDCNRLAKMGKTWEDLYAHLAAQIQDHEDSQAQAWETQEEYQAQMEAKIGDQNEANRMRFETIEATAEKNMSYAETVNGKLEATHSDVEEIRNNLGDFSIVRFQQLSSDFEGLSSNVHGVRSLRDETHSRVEVVAAELGSQVNSVLTMLQDKVSSTQLEETTQSQRAALGQEIQKHADNVTEHLLRTEKLEITAKSQGERLKDISHNIGSFKQIDFSALSDTVTAQQSKISAVESLVDVHEKGGKEKFNTLEGKIEDVKTSLNERALKTEVTQDLDSRDANMSERFDQLNNAIEKGKAKSDKIEASVDRTGLKVDVLQGNLGTINIKLFNELQSKVISQTKALALDKQERVFTQERVDKLEQQMDDRMRELQLQKPWQEAHDTLRSEVEVQESEIVQKIELVKEAVEETKVVSKSIQGDLESCTKKVSALEEKSVVAAEHIQSLSTHNDDHTRDFEELKKDHGKARVDLVTLSKHFGSFLDDIGVKLGLKASQSDVNRMLNAQKDALDERVGALASTIDEHNVDIVTLQEESASNTKLIAGLESKVQCNWDDHVDQATKLDKVQGDVGLLKEQSLDTRDDVDTLKSSVEQHISDVAASLGEKATARSLDDKFDVHRSQILEELSFTTTLARECQTSICSLKQEGENRDKLVQETKSALSGWNTGRFDTLAETVDRHGSELATFEAKHNDVKATIQADQEQLSALTARVKSKADKEEMYSRLAHQEEMMGSDVRVIHDILDEHNEKIYHMREGLDSHEKEVSRLQGSFGEWNRSSIESIGVLSRRVDEQASELGTLHGDKSRALMETSDQTVELKSSLDDLSARLTTETTRLENVFNREVVEAKSHMIERIESTIASLHPQRERVQESVDQLAQEFSRYNDRVQGTESRVEVCERAFDILKQHAAQIDHLCNLKEAVEDMSAEVRAKVSTDTLGKTLKVQEDKILKSAAHREHVVALEEHIESLRASVNTMSSEILSNVEQVVSEQTRLIKCESDVIVQNADVLSKGLDMRLVAVSNQAEENTAQVKKDSMKFQATFESYLKSLSGEVQQKANEDDVAKRLDTQKEVVVSEVAELRDVLTNQKSDIAELRTEVEQHIIESTEGQRSLGDWSKTSISSLNSKLDLQQSAFQEHKSQVIADASKQASNFESGLDRLSERLESETARVETALEERTADIESALVEKMESDIAALMDRSNAIQGAIDQLTEMTTSQQDYATVNRNRLQGCEKEVKSLQQQGASLSDLKKLKEVISSLSSDLHSKVSSEAFEKSLKIQESSILARVGSIERETTASQDQYSAFEKSLASLRTTVDLLSEDIITRVEQAVSENTNTVMSEARGIQDRDGAFSRDLDEHLQEVSSRAEEAAATVLRESMDVQSTFKSCLKGMADDIEKKANKQEVSSQLASLQNVIQKNKEDVTASHASFTKWSKSSIASLTEAMTELASKVDTTQGQKDRSLALAQNEASTLQASLNALTQKLESETGRLEDMMECRMDSLENELTQQMVEQAASMSLRSKEVQTAVDGLECLLTAQVEASTANAHKIEANKESIRSMEARAAQVQDLQEVKMAMTKISSELDEKLSSDVFWKSVKQEDDKLTALAERVGQASHEKSEERTTNMENSLGALRKQFEAMSVGILQNIHIVVSEQTKLLASDNEGLRSKTESLSRQVDDVASKTDSIASELLMKSTEARATFEAYLKELDSKVAQKADEQDVRDQLQAQGADIDSKLESMHEAVAGHDESIDTLRAELKQNKKCAVDLATNIDNVRNSDLPALEQKLDQSNAVENLETAVGSLTATVQEQKTKTEAQKKRSDSFFESFGIVGAQTEVLQQKVAQCEQDVSGLGQTVSTFGEKIFRNVSSLVEKQTGRIQSEGETMKSNIDALANDLVSGLQTIEKSSDEQKRNTEVLGIKVDACQRQLGDLDQRVERTKKERRAAEATQTDNLDRLNRKLDVLADEVDGKVSTAAFEVEVRQQSEMQAKVQQLEHRRERETAKTSQVQAHVDRLDLDILSIKSDIAPAVEDLTVKMTDQAHQIFMLKAMVLRELENKTDVWNSTPSSSPRQRLVVSPFHDAAENSETIEENQAPLADVVSNTETPASVNETGSQAFFEAEEELQEEAVSTIFRATSPVKSDATARQTVVSKVNEAISRDDSSPTFVKDDVPKQKKVVVVDAKPERKKKTKKVRRGKLKALIALRDDLKETIPVMTTKTTATEDECRGDLCVTSPSEDAREH